MTAHALLGAREWAVQRPWLFPPVLQTPGIGGLDLQMSIDLPLFMALFLTI